MATPEARAGLVQRLGYLGISPGEIDTLDPYHWGYHSHRLLLWIARGNLNVDNPKDKDGQLEKLGDPAFLSQASNAMRILEGGNRFLFERKIRALGLKVNSYPQQKQI